MLTVENLFTINLEVLLSVLYSWRSFEVTGRMKKYLFKALSLWYLLWQPGQTNTETMFLFIHSKDIYGASITYQALICEIGY